ncbi:MAG: TolC family protein [Sphingomonadales bacterium]|nr:TolC family protein [Sphingomonadales bacterium]
MMRRHFVMALMLALGACTTVVPPLATTPPPSSLGPFGQAVGANVEPAPLPSEWWRLFDDPALDGHIARALAVNTDIRVALANLEAARATFRQARAAIIPVAGIESGAGPDRADRQPSTSNVPKTSYELGATFAYEVDLFGRLRRLPVRQRRIRRQLARLRSMQRGPWWPQIRRQPISTFAEPMPPSSWPRRKSRRTNKVSHWWPGASHAVAYHRSNSRSPRRFLNVRAPHSFRWKRIASALSSASPPCRVKHPPRPTCCESDAPQFQP